MEPPDARPLIVAYDGSPESREAVREAAQLFAGAHVLVATVWEPGLAELTAAGAGPLPGMV